MKKYVYGFFTVILAICTGMAFKIWLAPAEDYGVDLTPIVLTYTVFSLAGLTIYTLRKTAQSIEQKQE